MRLADFVGILSLPVCCFAAEELVYLTADSPDTITHLEKGKVYILGGLVDRNAHKGLCFKKATVSRHFVENDAMHGPCTPNLKAGTSPSLRRHVTCHRKYFGTVACRFSPLGFIVQVRCYLAFSMLEVSAGSCSSNRFYFPSKSIASIIYCLTAFLFQDQGIATAKLPLERGDLNGAHTKVRGVAISCPID